MKSRVPETVIEQIRTEVDILEIVQGYVSLKKRGRNYFGLCPFHSEKTPSFSVSPDKQIYYCFGCHKGGDVFQFLIEMEQMSFYEAVSTLADKVGISIPNTQHDDLDPIVSEREIQVRKALELTAKLFHYLLKNTKEGRQARQYLQKRQIRAEAVDQFQLGYAPNSFNFLYSFLHKRGFHEEIMVEAGLISEKQTNGKRRYFDRFRDRLMFPIHDWRGRVIGFGGRALNDQVPKYLNSPETSLFHKGRFLFNFHRARSAIRQKQQLVLLEGYMDVIQTWQAGIENSVATLGTALTEQQAQKIAQNTETVILCYDADNAGQQAALRGIEMLKSRDCVVKVSQMPSGMDPDDYIQKYGAKTFQTEILEQALSSTHFRLEGIKKQFNLADEDQRLKCLDESIKVIAELSRAVERDHYLRKLAKEFQVSLDALKVELRRCFTQKKRQTSSSDPAQLQFVTSKQSKRTLTAVEQAERYLIAHMMRSRNVTEWVQQQLGAEFQGEVYAALAAYLYRYYQREKDANVSHFIVTLNDPMLKAKASELAMLEIPETIQKKELQDYVRLIQKSAIEKKLEEQKHQVEQLSATDPIQAAKMYQEIISQREQLKGKKV